MEQRLASRKHGDPQAHKANKESKDFTKEELLERKKELLKQARQNIQNINNNNQAQ